MIQFIDVNAHRCGRAFYDTIVNFDYKYANARVLPVDNRYADLSQTPYYLVSPVSFYTGHQSSSSDLTPEVIQRVRDGEIILLYDFAFEGDWRGIQSFIDYMDEISIPTNKYKIITGAGFVNGHSHPNVCHCPMFEVKARVSVKENITYKFGVTEHKKFLMLNARPRNHRVPLSYLVFERGLFDYGYCSLPHETKNNLEQYNVEYNLQVASQYGFNINPAIVSQFKSNLPYKIDDINPLSSLEINDSAIADIYQFVDFVVVTESLTATGENQVFITEKTMKAIANKKPFIVLGDQYTMKYLQQLGYKTFNFLINESYDSLPYLERTTAIVDEIERLCKVDFGKFKSQIDEVTEHNFQHMMSDDTYRARIDSLITFLSK